MRKAFIAIALFVVATNMGAQDNKNYTREGKTFVQTESQVLPNDQVTAYVWRDTKGEEYPIILHTYTKGEKEGKVVAYVIRKSAKSGKEYRYFLPNGEQIAKEILNENK